MSVSNPTASPSPPQAGHRGGSEESERLLGILGAASSMARGGEDEAPDAASQAPDGATPPEPPGPGGEP